MRQWAFAVAACLAAPFLSPAGAAWAGDAQRLQVEHVATPVGVTAPAPRFSWYLPGSVATRGVSYTQTVEVSQDPAFSTLVWSSPASPANVVAYAGPALTANERYYWRVHVANDNGAPSVDSSSFFGTGPIADADWQGAQWIKAPGADTPASPQFRTSVTTAPGKTVAWATLAVAGLGLNSVYIDDVKLDTEMDASNSDYNKTLFYIVHDVTAKLTAGTHGIGVVLGNGWYDTPEPDIYKNEQATWRKGKMLRAFLTVRYTDGTTDYKPTGTDWRTTASETSWSAPYGGEDVDLTKAIPHWSAGAFDDSAWAQPEIGAPPPGTLASQIMPPMRKMEAFRPIGPPTNPKPNIYVYKLAQNIAGWASVAVTSSIVGTVKVDYDETLTPPDSPYGAGVVTKALSKHAFYQRWQQDVFTVPAGRSLLEPRFSYKGFRYIQVTTAGAPPDWKNDVVAYAVYQNAPRTGSFTASDRTLARVHDAAVRTYVSNYQNFPTDCATREKQGWGADAQVAMEIGLYNFDMIAPYEHYFRLLRDGQEAGGGIPAVVPTWVAYKSGANAITPQAGTSIADPWWSGTILRFWEVYRHTGDRGVVEQNFPAAAAFMGTQGSPLTTSSDWLAPSSTAGQTIGLAGLYREYFLAGRAAALLGRPEAQTYDNASGFKNEYQTGTTRWFMNRYMYNADGTIKPGYNLPTLVLEYGMEPSSTASRSSLAKAIVDRITADNYAFTTGIISTKYLFKALHGIGSDDIAYRMVVNAAEPVAPTAGGSYNYMLNDSEGMTIWESWNTPAPPPNVPYSMSRNHPALGSVDAWLFEGVAGINIDQIDPSSLMIVPSPVGTVYPGMFAEATTLTARGPVTSRWERTDLSYGVTYTVTLPRGATAKLSVGVLGGFLVKRQTDTASGSIFTVEPTTQDPADAKRRIVTLSEGTNVIRVAQPYL